MTLSIISERCPDVVECIAVFCGARDAVILNRLARLWKDALARPLFWRRFLCGTVRELAHPFLEEKAVKALFGCALVHPSNFRAVVAAFTSSAWLDRYMSMKRALFAGRLKEPLPPRCRAQRSKSSIMKSLKAEKQEAQRRAKHREVFSTATELGRGLRNATSDVPCIAVAAPASPPVTPRNKRLRRTSSSLSPPPTEARRRRCATSVAHQKSSAKLSTEQLRLKRAQSSSSSNSTSSSDTSSSSSSSSSSSPSPSPRRDQRALMRNAAIAA
eukprot:TRINITY_DN21134_c0_g2_i1.p1 TRINITY_DN21134_c0_g2~~TRINITY_DN21134_c0_g2_i1.p1  ORF type:complete len:283 (+),score=31.21 TRINITY_DN21134_c0_g2_i1:35-850(+)